MASSPYLSTQSQPLFPPYALQLGGPTLTGGVTAIRIDPVSNSVSIAANSKPANPTAQTSASFSFSTTDAVATVQCQVDGGAFAPCTSPTTASYSSLAAGNHTFVVQSADAAGNATSASYTWTVTPPSNVSSPTLSGTAVVGQTLTASTGTWTGSPAPSFSYQWQDCDQSGQNCTAISGATSSTYTVGAGDVGSTLKVVVTGTTSAGSGQASSQASNVVQGSAQAPHNTVAPGISGTATQGQTLTASTGTWTGSPAPSFGYQWQDCDPSGQNCTAISGATSSSYTLGTGDVGSTVEVVVTGTNSAGSGQASSQASNVVQGSAQAPQNTVAPGISGTATQGQTLTASTGTWTGSPAPSFGYQWQDCDPSGQNCTAISGATSSTYHAGDG